MSNTRFTPRQLLAFVTVAHLKNFGRAGDQMNLSASAVSQLLGELESVIGFRLLDRTTRSVSLSAAGREFLPSANSVLSHMDLANSAANDIRNRAIGLVRIAAPMVIASTVLPWIIKAYTERHPKVVIRIRDATVDNFVDVVNRADADLAVGTDQAIGDGVVRTDLFKSPWVLWCSTRHSLARRRLISWAELNEYPLVVAGRDHERTLSLAYSGATKGQHITPVDIVDNISTAFGIVAAGLAVTIAPAYCGLLARALGLVMRPIVSPEVERQVCLYHSAYRPVSPAADGFREYLVKWFQGRDDFGMISQPDIKSPRKT